MSASQASEEDGGIKACYCRRDGVGFRGREKMLKEVFYGGGRSGGGGIDLY